MLLNDPRGKHDIVFRSFSARMRSVNLLAECLWKRNAAPTANLILMETSCIKSRLIDGHRTMNEGNIICWTNLSSALYLLSSQLFTKTKLFCKMSPFLPTNHSHNRKFSICFDFEWKKRKIIFCNIQFEFPWEISPWNAQQRPLNDSKSNDE